MNGRSRIRSGIDASPTRATGPDRLEDDRRQQLIDVALDCLAELGYVGSTLAQISGRAGVSSGLIAHYFGDKDGLLEAAFRQLSRRVRDNVRSQLRLARTPRGRVQAVIDANLAPQEFNQRTGNAWLAFWGHLLHAERLKRVQTAYQRRMLSNLRHALRQLLPRDEARTLAAMIAAMIDGVWLRAALSSWREADSEGARALLTAFVAGRLAAQSAPLAAAVPGARTASHVPVATHFTTVNPATGAALAELRIDGPSDIDAAVVLATDAQRRWAALTGTERGRILRRTAELLRERNAELAQIESRDTGKPIRETSVVDVISGADCLEYYAGIAPTLAGEHVDLGPGAFGYTRREPLGVVAAIGAWNYPLQNACRESAPALACGNAMIFKPAALTPLTAVELQKVYAAAGLPPGIFQVIQGKADTAQLLSHHPGIRKTSAPSEVGSGWASVADAASTRKDVPRELGGRLALLVFDDATLDNAVGGALLASFYSAGAVCSNGSRVFVQRAVKAAFLERIKARVAKIPVGDPLDPATQVGPLICEAHMEKVLGYIARGHREGARLLIGGNRVTSGALAHGYFVAPTVFDGCPDEMTIVREDIFGPVMTVLEFSTEDEVVARVNGTEYGLSAGVFTNDLTRAHRLVARLEADTCWINDYNVMPIELPFGGYQRSGPGRANGRAAIEHYTQLKRVYVALGNVVAPY